MPSLRIPFTYTVRQISTHLANRGRPGIRRNFGEWVEFEIPVVEAVDAPIAASWSDMGINRQIRKIIIRHFDGRNYMELEPFSGDRSYSDLSDFSQSVCQFYTDKTLEKLQGGKLTKWEPRRGFTVFASNDPTDIEVRHKELDFLSKGLIIVEGRLFAVCHDPQVSYSFNQERPRAELSVTPATFKNSLPEHSINNRRQVPVLWSIGNLEAAKTNNMKWFQCHPEPRNNLIVAMPEVFTDDLSGRCLDCAVWRMLVCLDFPGPRVVTDEDEGPKELESVIHFRELFETHKGFAGDKSSEEVNAAMEKAIDNLVSDLIDKDDVDVFSKFLDALISDHNPSNIRPVSVVQHLAAALDARRNRPLELSLEGFAVS